MKIEIMATLWPEMLHWRYFAAHPNLHGIRLNTAKAEVATIDSLVREAVRTGRGKPIYFDIKGRQLRVEEAFSSKTHLEIKINREIEVKTPTTVLFKSGADAAVLQEVKDGNHLIFGPGEESPEFMVTPGDSLNIRDKSLKVYGETLPAKQLRFLEVAMKYGITRFMLSFATSMDEIHDLRKVVGPDAEIIAKIEDPKGLDFAKNRYLQRVGLFGREKPKNTSLLCARGDLYVEVDKPHDILAAQEDIIKVDPDAILGSRILLSVTDNTVPECADINEIALLLKTGYRRFMFCDGLCLKQDALDRAIAILDAVASEFKS